MKNKAIDGILMIIFTFAGKKSPLKKQKNLRVSEYAKAF